VLGYLYLIWSNHHQMNNQCNEEKIMAMLCEDRHILDIFEQTYAKVIFLTKSIHVFPD
jgi:hypothetical protein